MTKTNCLFSIIEERCYQRWVLNSKCQQHFTLKQMNKQKK